MGTMADAAMPRGGPRGRGSGCLTGGEGGAAGSRITSEGQSASWQQSKKNVKNIVDVFLRTTDTRKRLAGAPDGPWTMDSITAEQACTKQLYEEFAGYLATEYVCTQGKNRGNYLKMGPAACYLNSLALQMSNKYKHVSDATRLFFTCKEKQGSSDEWVWFNGVRSNMKGIIHERAARRGEQTNASAPPIYPSDVDKMVAALSKEGSMHSAVVKFVLLTTILTGGRPCEPQYLSLQGMSDDDEFNVTQGESSQIKTTKTKIWSIAPASQSHRSWHLALGDYLSLVERESVECEKDEFGEDVPDALWLIPELQLVECPGTWLTNAIKALLPQDRGGSVK